MADVATPQASRLQKPSWRDARLLVGLLLVLVATVLGSLAVASADDRVPMYAASAGLVAGQPLTPERVRRVDAQLGEAAGTYLSAAAGLPPDAYVLREVRAGELIPRSAVGSRGDVGVQPLTLSVEAPSAAPLVVGSVVDVYVDPVADGGTGGGPGFAGPELALEAVPVASLPERGTGFGSGSRAESAVQVMAPRERIRELIGHIDLGARVTLVPVAGSALAGER